MIDEAVAEFRGTYLQQPPVYSAKKIDGDRAYDLARRNAPVRLQPVQVTATTLDVLEWRGTMLRLRLVCSPATTCARSPTPSASGWAPAVISPRWCERAAATSRWRTPLASTCSTAAHEARARVIPLAALLPSLPAITLTQRGRVAGRARRVHRAVARRRPASLPATRAACGCCTRTATWWPSPSPARAMQGAFGSFLHPGVVLE